jgi:hypothetical protein
MAMQMGLMKMPDMGGGSGAPAGSGAADGSGSGAPAGSDATK